jgi:uncharacterized protein YdhG (YjbR/CyaY superfamily)
MSPQKEMRKSAVKSKGGDGGSAAKGMSEEEKAEMKEHVQEYMRETRGEARPENESAVLAKIAGMKEPDRSIAKRLHAIVKADAPELSPRTWYGSPAYSNRDGKVVLFFQDAQKFKTRYGTLGFSDSARLDDGAMWPVAYAVKEMNAAVEEKIRALVKKAAG